MAITVSGIARGICTGSFHAADSRDDPERLGKTVGTSAEWTA
jgi:hypothetical protein